jgi:hypothetical protein
LGHLGGVVPSPRKHWRKLLHIKMYVDIISFLVFFMILFVKVYKRDDFVTPTPPSDISKIGCIVLCSNPLSLHSQIQQANLSAPQRRLTSIQRSPQPLSLPCHSETQIWLWPLFLHKQRQPHEWSCSL